jgi:F0F1-type ATP synthase delta subunit
MIELTPLARPYAKALFASANESNNLEEMANELKIIAAASKSEGVINTYRKSHPIKKRGCGYSC